MNTKQSYVIILLLGIIFIGSGVFLVATDYKNIRDTYKKMYYSFSRQFTPEQIKETEPNDNTPEKLKSDLKMAEEYLRQNSYESIRKALDIYNRVLSFANDQEIIQLAKYGLAYSLYRLYDENRSLQILRDLKKEKIVNPVLEEEIHFLLGKILLLRGHEDEGKSILQNLLAKTDSSNLKSRIHVTFGDYYYLKRQYKKAKKSYLIALEYDPDNLHAEIIKENLLSKKKKLVPFEHEYYDQYLFSKIFDKESVRIKKESHKESKEEEKETDKKEPKKSQKDLDEILESLNKKLIQSNLLLSKNEYSTANNLLIEIEKEINELLEDKKIKEKHKNQLYKLLENVYYRLGEVTEKQNNPELAKSYFDNVLENPDGELDQPALIKKGVLYFEEGQYNQAYKIFKKAIEISPNGKFVDKAKEWLAETEKILREQEK